MDMGRPRKLEMRTSGSWFSFLTVNQYEVTFDIEKNDDGHWVISTENYRSLVSDFMNDGEKASEFVYPDGTEYQESGTQESTTSNSSL